jgi:dihydrofolate synthase/folylpolyglutamate synthase
MTYQQVLDFLLSFKPSVIRLGLEKIHHILKEFGQPQDRFPSVLIAGTNGKGSTTAMISSILQAEGWKVGSYTSPHLLDLRERITINGNLIPEEDLITLTEEFIRILSGIRSRKSVEAPQDLTFFEVITILAFLYFAQQQIDIAVLEVGLGGRLDATNVVNPLVSVITNISMDHENYLGSTRREIAREKAGIVKENGICITACEPGEALEEIEAICNRKNAQLFKWGTHFTTSPVQSSLTGQIFSYQGMTQNYDQLEISLLGRHQILNAALAVGTMELLKSRGFPVQESNLRRGLKVARNPGRLEIIGHSPRVVLDAAHNPGGAEALSKALIEFFTYDQLILVMGILKDKNIRGIFKALLPIASQVIFTQPQNTERATPAQELARIAQEMHWDKYQVAPQVSKAIELAHNRATPKSLICITGSLYTIAEAKQFYAEVKGNG